jgi:hypothetical protein
MVGAILAGLVASGCGSQSPAPVAVNISDTADSFFSQVEALQSSIMGTPEQWARASTVQQQGEQRDYSDCMKKAGFQYDVPTVDWVHPQPKLYEPFWWSRPSMDNAAHGIGYAPRFEPDAGSSRAADVTSYDSLSEAQKVAYDGALDGCVQAVSADASVAEAQLTEATAVQASLQDSLEASSNSKEFASSKDTYADCMSAAGVHVSDPGRLFELAEAAVIKTGLLGLDMQSSEYASVQPRALQAEVALARTDVSCRAKIADAIASALNPTLDSWMATNRQRVDALVTGWSAIGN